jgi:hypothetical protein
MIISLKVRYSQNTTNLVTMYYLLHFSLFANTKSNFTGPLKLDSGQDEKFIR